jgi:2-isopropylmalate synthase
MAKIQLYDTTLRDGTQREGISFSVEDKLKIVRKLDELGIPFIEGGWPISNPKDVEFFVRVRDLELSQATITACGSTRRAHTAPERDAGMRALVDAHTRIVTIVGKSWDLHVTDILETTLEENLAMISDSVAFLRDKGITVFYDAEHFFDGFKANPEYALDTLKSAAEAGAECLVLCDTNGGAITTEVVRAINAVKEAVPVSLGIHTHNDCDLAVANTLAAVRAGVGQVQGTINGYGERCGNANLCSVIPNLQLKLGLECLTDEQLSCLADVSRYVAELANLSPDTHMPFVGDSAFTHKAGLHVAAVRKLAESYQHIDPDLVGNKRRVLVSELSGRSNVLEMAKAMGVDLKQSEAQRILDEVKAMESRGFQYEVAEASLELLMRRSHADYVAPFELVDFMVIVERRRRAPSIGNQGDTLAEAVVKVKVNGEIMHTAAEGDGPVNALDNALRKALIPFYPSLEAVRLTDYKVRILDETAGTEASVRVLIESSDGTNQWRTVGSSTNLIEASWLALADGLEYWLLKWNEGSRQP